MPAYSRPYDARDYDPAMPVAELALLSLETGEPLVNLTAVVDTGADATMIPIDVLTAAGALYLRARRLVTVTGHARPVDIYLTTVQLGPHVVHAVRAVAMPAGSEPIIGRDVLNELEILLNGPAQELWIA